MKKLILCLLLVACALLVGCAEKARSISNSGYRPESGYSGYRPAPADKGSDPAFAYRGELSEFDVLGITRGQATSESEIAEALDNARRVKLSPSSSILLIQSGALFPDASMAAELSKHFRVVQFSGLPSNEPAVAGRHKPGTEAQSYAKSLRLAAARGGNDIILCYWGMIESAKEN